LWGSSVLTPLTAAAGREPSQLSLYAFFATSFLSPFRGFAVPGHIAQAILVLAGSAAFLRHVVRGGDQVEGLLLGLLALLAAYPLGHFQFYLPFALLVPLYLTSVSADPRASWWLIVLLSVVSFFATCYLAFGGLVAPPWLYIRQNAGLPAFVVECGAIFALLRAKVVQ
jgi:hypothetical protein